MADRSPPVCRAPEQAPAGAGKSEPTRARTAAVLDDLLARPLGPGLYLVATPIGHLGDLTLRAVATLAAADVVYCEDTRHSRTLLAHYGIATPLRSYHDHNAAGARPEILDALAASRRVALISDAGTPLISDPGYKLVRAALAAGHVVTALPGASAVLAALAVAGLPTDAFTFVGFLPPKTSARQSALARYKGLGGTLVLFEAPGRTADLLADIATVLGDPDVVVARELTKLNEEVRRDNASALAVAYAESPPRGEVVVLIAPGLVAAPDDAAILAHLATALRSETVRDAASEVAEALGVARGRVYALALALKQKGDDA